MPTTNSPRLNHILTSLATTGLSPDVIEHIRTTATNAEDRDSAYGIAELQVVAARTFALWDDTPTLLKQVAQTMAIASQTDQMLHDIGHLLALLFAGCDGSTRTYPARQLEGFIQELTLHPHVGLTRGHMTVMMELAQGSRRFQGPQTQSFPKALSLIFEASTEGHIFSPARFLEWVPPQKLVSTVIALLQGICEAYQAMGRQFHLVHEFQLFRPLRLDDFSQYVVLFHLEEQQAYRLIEYYRGQWSFDTVLTLVCLQNGATQGGKPTLPGTAAASR